MGKASKKKNTRPPRLKKRKVGITVRSKAKIKPKGSQRAKSDTIENAPTKVPSNLPVFKIKIRKKQ